jgi:hypothetical protein
MNDEEVKTKKKDNKIVFIIIGVVAICCIGAIAFFALGSTLPDFNNHDMDIYEDEIISFKYPNACIIDPEYSNNTHGDFYYYVTFVSENASISFYRSMDFTYSSLDDVMEYFKINTQNNNPKVKNCSVKKININGVPVLEETFEFTDGTNGIFLLFIKNNNRYYLSFDGTDLNNVKNTYELVKPTIVIK